MYILGLFLKLDKILGLLHINHVGHTVQREGVVCVPLRAIRAT